MSIPLREELNMSYKADQYVEVQFDDGSSRNLRIQEVLERDCYIVNVDGNRVMIHESNILGRNLSS